MYSLILFFTRPHPVDFHSSQFSCNQSFTCTPRFLEEGARKVSQEHRILFITTCYIFAVLGTQIMLAGLMWLGLQIVVRGMAILTDIDGMRAWR